VSAGGAGEGVAVLVDEVVEEAGAREQRRRVLSAWLTVYFTLALFMDRGWERVMRKPAGVLAWAEDAVRLVWETAKPIAQVAREFCHQGKKPGRIRPCPPPRSIHPRRAISSR
jgi:hypothetical protein